MSANALPKIVLLCLVFWSTLSLAQPPLTLEQRANDLALDASPFTRYLTSADCPANNLAALKQCPEFRINNQPSFNFGFTPASYWYQTRLNYAGNEPLEIYIEAAYSMLDDIQFWLQDEASGQTAYYYRTGDHRLFDERPISYPTFVFPVTLQPGHQYTMLLRVATSSSMQVPLKIWSPAQFVQYKRTEMFIQGGLLGILLIMAMYNLALYLTVRDSSYLFFVFCLIGYAGISSILTGTAYAYFWPNAPFWNSYCLVFTVNLTVFALAQFSRRFLHTDRSIYPYSLCLNILSIFGLILAVLSPFLPYQQLIRISAISACVVAIFCYVLGILQWRSGFASARYFVLAFSAFVISALVFVLNKFGLVTRNTGTEVAIHFGVVTTIGLFSLALADRINSERKDKEAARQEVIDTLDRFRSLFENSFDGIFRTDTVGRLLSANPSFVRIVSGKQATTRSIIRRKMDDFLIDAQHNFDFVLSALNTQGFVINLETECRRLNGELFWAAVSARQFVDSKTGKSFIEGSLVDISERKQGEQQLTYLASHDPLTNLLNRIAFEQQLQQALQSARLQQQQHTLLFIDLDRFKIVNDTCGHAAGDELLKQLAHLLKQHVRQLDALARFGGDEFALLLTNCPLERGIKIGHLLKEDLNAYKFMWDGKSFSVGCSIGAVPITAQSGTTKELFNLADQACYTAKDEGRNRIVVQQQQSAHPSRRANEALMITAVNEALEKNLFVLFSQPIVPLQNQALGACYEILLRLPKQGSLLSPGSFMPAAERYNVMAAIDRWVIRAYFKWLSGHRSALDHIALVSINLSAQTLTDSNLLNEITGLLVTHGIPGNKICFEITESVALSSMNDTIQFIQALKQYGVRFALDDFGSGYATYSYLIQLPVDFVKIDGAFVKSMLLNPVNMAIVKSIVDVAHVMKLQVIAEFVETELTRQKLIELGVDFAQGYHLGKPKALDAIT